MDITGRQLGLLPIAGQRADLSALTPGMYVLRVTTTAGQTIQRVMKR
jgi:hypothetical protein